MIQTAVEMEAGLLVTMPVSNGSTLAVLAAAECELGLISREMGLLAEQAGVGPGETTSYRLRRDKSGKSDTKVVVTEGKSPN